MSRHKVSLWILSPDKLCFEASFSCEIRSVCKISVCTHTVSAIDYKTSHEKGITSDALESSKYFLMKPNLI